MSDASVWTFVIGAYAVTWIGLIGYGVRLLILNRRARAAAAALGGDR